MALQTSPPISLNDIKAEFGASGTRSLTDFYRGGAFVPDIPANSIIPTSGAIGLLDFLGATASPIVITDRNVGQLVAPPNTAFAGYSLQSNGQAQYTQAGQYVDIPGEWLISGSGSSFDVRATMLSGAIASGVFGSWLNLGTSRAWSNQHGGGSGSISGVMRLDFRAAGGGAILASAQIMITAAVR